MKYPNFTEERWCEIYAARARLQAYADKIQPYPALPEEEKPPEVKHIFIYEHSNLTPKLADRITQLERRLSFDEKKLPKHTPIEKVSYTII